MSLFVSSTAPPRVKTKNIQSISILYASTLVLVALLQLFHFEEFPGRLEDVGITSSLAPLLATFIVVAEVLALPFALRMHLSPAFRIVSMVVGWLVCIKLLAVAIIENVASPGGYDAVFGATLPLPIGGWTICATLALCVLAGWTAWGMWPFKVKK
jgi:hypothetical protein